MNLTEKRRAEALVADWKRRALEAVPPYDTYRNKPTIEPPAAILRKRDQLAKIALELQDAGWNVSVHVVACGPGGPGLDQVATLSPCPEMPAFKALGEARIAARAEIERQARALIGRIWSDEATFAEIVEASR